MGKSSLGRVLDPSALDACEGPRARLRVGVPAAWLVEGAVLRISAPARLACARCDGGGCDACARSGALRAPAEAGDRVVRATLSRWGETPQSPRSRPSRLRTAAVLVRIPHPFGPGHDIRQLLLEVSAAPEASSGVAREAPPEPEPVIAGPSALRSHLPLSIAALAALATILWALFGR